MFENLSERLERSFKILKGEGKITEINVAETVKDIRKALLDADVSYKVAKDFCNRVKDKAMGANVLTAVKPQQMMVKITHDELAAFMGSRPRTSTSRAIPPWCWWPVSTVPVKPPSPASWPCTSSPSGA